MTKEQEALWQEMADLTLKKCREHCHDLGSCCSSEYCEEAAENMKKAGVELGRFPQSFTGTDGKCMIPPHFRPLCTLHQCKISGLGLDPKDPEWTGKYFELREKLESTMVGWPSGKA